MSFKKIPRQQFLYEISKLHYIDKISQKELALIYKVSTATISRTLQEAEDMEIVSIKVNDILGTKRKLENELESKYNLKKAVISFVPYNDESLIKNIVGKSAASFINEVLHENMMIGIAWGSSLYEMVKFLKSKPLNNLKVVDLIGSVGKLFSDINASELARKFAQNFNAENYFLNSLALVQNKETKEFLVREKEIKDVLEMAKRLDMAIISIGTVSFDSVVIKDLKIDRDTLEDIRSKGALGDICLRFFDKNGNKVKTGLDSRIIGIDLDDFKKVKMKICVSGGLSKLEAIKAALRNKFIDILITDSLVAEVLLNGKTNRVNINIHWNS
ncbi:MAG: sugar-binding transcriptional regulator [Actinobacteria bacterium]|nr:sugar-binding transcriptional regulator [Actinomycetota bacterium]